MEEASADKMTDHDAIGLFAHRLADQAAEVSSSYFRGGLEIDLKGDDSPVTLADRQIEREVREALAKAYPDHAILGEEYGAGDLTNDHVWVVDPIDGTRSFISGQPLYGFLLAHMEKGRSVFGMISMPELNERYIGQVGRGAVLNGVPISTSGQTVMSEAIVYINEGDKLLEFESEIISRLLRLGHTTRFSYDCYPHALLAAGHIDLVVDYDLKPFDFLPLKAVIEEAGGVISDWAGEPLGYRSSGRVVSAATPALHEQAIDMLSGRGGL